MSMLRDINRAVFPDAVRGPVQYGDRVQALVAYFAHQHFIPVDRVCQIFEDIFHIDISSGTCSSVDERLYQKLESFESSLKAYLLAARVLHFDETGMRCEKKLYWVHVASSQAATLYMMHPRRGRDAMDEMGILSQFDGIAVHDHWFPYFSYDGVVHSLCNAHHLRELEFVEEQEKENWAKQMKSLLLRAKQAVEKCAGEGKMPADTLLEIEREYTQIITEGIEYHSRLLPMSHGKRGRQKQFLGYMQSTFPGRVTSYSTLRSSNNQPIDYSSSFSPYLRGEEALIDCLLLSKGRILIRTSSNLSLWSTYFNPSLPVVELTKRY